jgi:copper resistance protein B
MAAAFVCAHAIDGAAQDYAQYDHHELRDHHGYHEQHRHHEQHGQHREQGSFSAHSRDEPSHGHEQTQSELEHVPPAPPRLVLPPTSAEEMSEMMQMDDAASIGMVQADQLEWRSGDGPDALAWKVHAWYGNDYDKLWIETEGEHIDSDAEGRAEVLWDHVVSRWWSVQVGARQDFGAGPSRTWAAVGLQGLAPYFIDIDASFYVGEGGRTALRVSAEQDLFITQRWVLQPELELDAYGKDDARNHIASGLSKLELALRLRYEIRRELAPYIGIGWQRGIRDTADLAREEGKDVSVVTFLAGVRAWF